MTDAVLVAITIAPLNPAVSRGSTLQLSAFGMFSDASQVDLTDQVVWTSTNTTIATINNTDHKGVVTGVSGGSTTIQADLTMVTGVTTLFAGN